MIKFVSYIGTLLFVSFAINSMMDSMNLIVLGLMIVATGYTMKIHFDILSENNFMKNKIDYLVTEIDKLGEEIKNVQPLTQEEIDLLNKMYSSKKDINNV